MIAFTLDTNCLIDLEEKRENAAHVERLRDAWKAKTIELNVVASSGSEKQQSGDYADSLEAFVLKLSSIGLSDCTVLPTLGRWGVGFWDNMLYGGEEGYAREREIWGVMFPSSTYDWEDFAKENKIEPEDTASKAVKKWRNQLLDVQAYWSHEYHKKNIFVTSDRRFFELNGHPQFVDANVQTPKIACSNLFPPAMGAGT